MSFIFKLLIDIWYKQVPKDQQKMFVETLRAVYMAIGDFLTEHT
jgi:hypothetical protein